MIHWFFFFDCELFDCEKSWFLSLCTRLISNKLNWFVINRKISQRTLWCWHLAREHSLMAHNCSKSISFSFVIVVLPEVYYVMWNCLVKLPWIICTVIIVYRALLHSNCSVYLTYAFSRILCIVDYHSVVSLFLKRGKKKYS